MKFHTAYLTFNTKKRKDIIPITDDVECTIRESGVQEGLALVSAMHLTASVIIQDEESGLHHDIMEWAEQLAPVNPAYRHHQTGEDNGDAHLKNLLLHHQVVLPITNGRIDLAPGNVSSTASSMGNAPNGSSSRLLESNDQQLVITSACFWNGESV